MKRTWLLLIVCLAQIAVGLPTLGATISPAKKDAYWRSSTIYVSYGLFTKGSGTTDRAYIEFTLPNATVSSAKLWLYQGWTGGAAGSNTVRVRGETTSLTSNPTWCETSGCSAPSGTTHETWTQAAADVSVPAGLGSTAQWYSWDITTIFNAKKNTAVTFSIRNVSGSGDGPIFVDKEGYVLATGGYTQYPYIEYVSSSTSPIIAEVSPDPDTALANTEYQRQLTLVQGQSPITWSVVQGPTGLVVDQTGKVSGWTPGTGDIGNTFTIEIRATNAYGLDDESWQVNVVSQPPPIIAEVSPDPDTAMASAQYQRQLTLTQGASPITWSKIQGPTALVVDQTGKVSGWTPSSGDIGNTFTVEIRAQNPYGADNESWQVNVVSSMPTVPKWGMYEVSYTASGSPSNPFADTTFTATVTAPDSTQRTVDGFYDGDGNGGQSGKVFKLRFSPDQLGTWSWITSSNDSGLNAKSGQFQCVAPTTNGPIIKSGRYFYYGNGDPVYLIGNFLDRVQPTYEEFSHTLFSEEITETNRQNMIVRHRDFHRANKMNIYIANNGDYGDVSTTPWVGSDDSNDKTRFDLSRWKMYDRLVAQVRDEGMVAELWFFADDSNFGSLSDAEIQRLIKYGEARLSPYVNTMFVLALEWQEGFSSSEVISYCTYGQQHNPWDRLWSVHCSTGNFSFPNESWADFMATQSGNSIEPPANNTHTITNRNLANKPLIVEEFGLLDSTYDKRLRGNLWACFCGGGAGSGTGSDLPRLRKFIEDLDVPFWAMAPNNGLSNSGFTLANVGNEYVVYVQNGGTFTVQLASGSYYAQWFSPRQSDGNAGPIAIGNRGGGSQSFTTPNSDDWVLHIRVTADTQAPSIPTNVTATAQTPKMVKVTWTASTDNVGVTGYKVHRNGSQIGTCATTSYTDTGRTPSTTYSYTVSAYDAASNNSAQSSPPATATTMQAMDIAAAKQLQDSSQVGLVSKIVTAVFGNSFYVTEADRHAGIKVVPVVLPTGLAPGSIVDVGGTMLTSDNERHIAGATVTVY